MQLRLLRPFSAVLVGLAIPAPMVIWSRDVGSFFLSIFVFAPFGILLELFFLLAILFGRQEARRDTIAALFCLPIASLTILGALPLRLNDRLAWLGNADIYKRRLAKEPSSANGLKHFEWAESGFAGMNLFEYVVFDPSDRLGNALQKKNVGQVASRPCDPGMELRFERGYYLVGSSLPWEDCGEH